MVSAASGAVGSVVGQLAKLKGCRAVGIAGGPEKCRFVVKDTLGFDDCVDHRGARPAPPRSRAACPNGIDVYFENVGGAVQDAVWPLLNDFARVPLCGMISQYNEATPRPGPDLALVLRKRLTVRGFIVTDFAAESAGRSAEMRRLDRRGPAQVPRGRGRGAGEARPRPSSACCRGKNFGKLLVKLA